jgi:hypothetical protein
MAMRGLCSFSFAASRGRLKGARYLIVAGNLTGFAPGGTVFDDPIGQRTLEPDVVTGFFRLNPFVFKDFLALGLKLAVERGIPQ